MPDEDAFSPLDRAVNGGWVVREGINDGMLRPFHAFTSTEDLLKALPELLEPKITASKAEELRKV